MKRIELLLQGKKVENMTGTGYYEISEGRFYNCVNDKKIESDVLSTKFLLEEGEEFIPKKKACFYKKDGCLFRIREKFACSGTKITCEDILGCTDISCEECILNDQKTQTVKEEDIVIIEY